MNKVKIYESKIIIPTYPEPAAEEMPMFAENRVHQRSSGRPYPNKVVMEVDRTHKEDKEYKLVTLENEYVKIEILPEIGGRIYSAYDKTTGYDYFYKQHVIKPALIGVLAPGFQAVLSLTGLFIIGHPALCRAILLLKNYLMARPLAICLNMTQLTE